MHVGFARRAVLLVTCLACSNRTSHERTSDFDAGATFCSASETRACVGPGACDGGQVCSADGSRWSACDCGLGAGGGLGSGGVNSAGGANPQGGGGQQAGGGPQGGSAPQGGTPSTGGSDAGGGSGGSIAGSGSGGNDPCVVELLSDPGFDQGLGSWSQGVSNGSRSAIVSETDSPIPAHSAPNLAWLGGRDAAEDWVLQTVTVTQPMARLKASMYIRIETLEEENVAFDRVVLDTQVEGDLAVPRITLDNRNANAGYTFYEADVPSVLAGTQITVAVAMSNDGNLPTAFYVDSLSLTANVCE